MTITKLLIANRGEIARRIIRTCHSRGIATVAVFSVADVDAPFVREADESVALGGRSPAESYLRQNAILDAAARTGADAIHPGYGFLAENASFAQACLDQGLTFLGPSPAAITAMGSKIAAREMMADAGVPLAPAMTLDTGGTIDPASIAAQIGLPLIVKASAGGGGKGMRIVHDADGVGEAIRTARSEARAAFGDDAVFIERYVEGARHVEVQIIGDRHGEVSHLFERDCSIQRRHQKIIEEAPAPGLSPETRARFTDIAITAGRKLGYESVGTVEFLYDDHSQDIYFREINTRLQVEHPVTEAITGLDLVAAQIDIAEGRPLAEVIGQPRVRGHAVEARLYAEDPAAGFLPATGRLTSFSFPDDTVRVDAGPEAGGEVTADYDPMIAKVIAHGTTRLDACRILARALRGADIAGLQTNRDFLVRLLEDEAFRAGRVSTAYLDTGLDALTRPLATRADAGLMIAAALARQAARRSEARRNSGLPSGWRNVGRAAVERRFAFDDAEVTVGYDLATSRFWIDGEETPAVVVHAARADAVDLQIDGIRRQYRITADQDGVVNVGTTTGQFRLRELPRFGDREEQQAPGSLAAPLPGKVIDVRCSEGQNVVAGQLLLVVEAMKIQHEICAETAGVVQVLRVAEGDQVDAGAVIAIVAADEEESSG
jgi:acetyl/propionyl-CoA carboxylase alpha subunit